MFQRKLLLPSEDLGLLLLIGHIKLRASPTFHQKVGNIECYVTQFQTITSKRSSDKFWISLIVDMNIKFDI